MDRLKPGVWRKEATPPTRWDWSGRGFHVDYQPDEVVPLQREDELGTGSSGVVYKTICNGVALAWKTKPRHSNEQKEIDSLKKLSHLHIVGLVGTFTHRQSLSMLLWPVAVCDLATFFKDLDVFKTHQALRDFKKSNPDPIHRFTLLGIDVKGCRFAADFAREWLYQSFGCLAGAVHYIHRSKMRHKDLKPSNILLTPTGIMLTDFGSSTDFSNLPSSESNNGERGTPLYFAPEVADRKDSGRPADIFSLGCVFLEMVWSSCMLDRTMDELKCARSGGDHSFHANLDSIRQMCVNCIPWAISGSCVTAIQHLLLEIRQMLDPNPKARPTAFDIQSRLVLIEGFKSKGEWSLYRHCCKPIIVSSKAVSKSEISDLRKRLDQSDQPIAIIYRHSTYTGGGPSPTYNANSSNMQASHPQLRRDSTPERHPGIDHCDENSPPSSSEEGSKAGQQFVELGPDEGGHQAVSEASKSQSDVRNSEGQNPSPRVTTSGGVRTDQDQTTGSPAPPPPEPPLILQPPPTAGTGPGNPAIDEHLDVERRFPQILSRDTSPARPLTKISPDRASGLPKLDYPRCAHETNIPDNLDPRQQIPRESKNPYYKILSERAKV
ncbi:MAG: hypothetical protein M1839_003548 [Geoglossum umbratile]|nr:MAG: hypothetical protein M1839_003548 [Geoglossum umbratile]